MRKRDLKAIFMAVILLCGGARVGKVQESPAMDRALAEALNRARDLLMEGKPADAASVLNGYRGQDSPELRMLMGHAYSQAGDPAQAETAYRRALELDRDSKDAMQGLARACIAQEKWEEARKWLGAALDIRTADADWLAAYASVAQRLSDDRLCRILVDAGIARFPDDLRFRRLDLSMLLDADSPRATEAAMYLVKRRPDDTQAWGWLARAHRQADRPVESRAALRAQWMLSPDTDASARLAYMQTCLADGDWLRVVEEGRAALADARDDQPGIDLALLEVFIAAAEQGGRDDLVTDWVHRVPQADRTPQILVAETRSAIRTGRDADALEALVRLIELGAADATAYMNAAQAAERLGRDEEAQVLYQEAEQMQGPAARLATLYRARLLARLGRLDEARAVLRAHLTEHPLQAEARALLRLLEEHAETR